MTTYIDVFNGDADGIFSLIQWRKSNPLTEDDTQYLVTGVKRDISLVSKIDSNLLKDSIVTVLDLSFDKNAEGVDRALSLCDELFYCDHHKADKLFEHVKLKTCINTDSNVCTGLLVNAELSGKYPLWAITAAFGDGLDTIADKHVYRQGLSQIERDSLRELGVLINYNGYGSSVDDLYFNPSKLYKKLEKYDSPLDIVSDSESPFLVLKSGYEADMTKARKSKQLFYKDVVVFILEDASWARRISGTFGNQLAVDNPDKPVVVATINAKGSYTISLRAPKTNLRGASAICSQFSSGGGREGAAGINNLPLNQLDSFLEVVDRYYKS